MTLRGCITLLAVVMISALSAQETKYRVEGGVMHVITQSGDSTVQTQATLATVPLDTTKKLSKRQLRLDERARQDADTSFHRYSRLFRDTIPISRLCAISLVAPGFGQLYNNQAWKIPILYASVGVATYLGFKQSSKYSTYKSQYDALVRQNAGRDLLDPVQNNMIRHNTTRQLLFAGAIASYIYFIGDAAVNYPGKMSSIKKATTLSTICPGAGQVYNGSYWKLPIVVGGFATMAYVIDWNNRGYQRLKLAYDLLTDGDDSTVDEFNGRRSPENIQNMRKAFRRSRDLAIILTAALYVLNIVDAHVDAQLKDYDISDDLARVTFEPTMGNLYTRSRGNTQTIGMSLNIRF